MMSSSMETVIESAPYFVNEEQASDAYDPYWPDSTYFNQYSYDLESEIQQIHLLDEYPILEPKKLEETSLPPLQFYSPAQLSPGSTNTAPQSPCSPAVPTPLITVKDTDPDSPIVLDYNYEGCISHRPNRAAVQANPEVFLKEIFPGPNQAHLRESVRREVIATEWWLKNEPELPRTLNVFIRRIKAKEFECLSCGKKIPRIDRAIDHFRTHIDHRPFHCNGERDCGDTKCKMAFYTKDCLKAHYGKTEVTCNDCGTIVEDKNLGRHKNTRKCRRSRGHPYARPS